MAAKGGKKTFLPESGITQQYFITQCSVDRTNLFTGEVEAHYWDENFDTPNSNRMSLGAGDAVFSGSGISALAHTEGGNPICVGVQRRWDANLSKAIYTYTFEGVINVHDKQFVDFEFEFTLNQEPIETHPKFQSLNDSYGPYDPINRLWPRFISQRAQAAGLSGGQTTTAAGINPMFGVSSYLSPGCIYRITYTDLAGDKNPFEGIGTIWPPASISRTASIPGVASWLGDVSTRTWLKMAPKVRRHGNAVTIIEEYMLSGVRGWFPPIYGAEAFKQGR